jgi:hypothetical protein
MADYLMEFEAHIVEDKRPEGFPRSVFVREHYINVDSDQQLKEIYNNRFKALVTQPGIAVFPEDEPIDASALNFDQRFFVPWHMIAYFHGRVKILTPAPVVKTPSESLDPSDPIPVKENTLVQ